MLWSLGNILLVLKDCYQPRVKGGEIGFKEPWLIRCRGGALGYYFIYNGRAAVPAHPPPPPLNMQQTIRIYAFFKKIILKKSDECTGEELMKARIRIRVFKLFFHQYVRDG